MVNKLAALLLAAVLALSLFPGAAQAAGNNGTLKIGDQNEYVIQLQERLHQLGYLFAAPTGYYGTKTQQAVLNYQHDNNLLTDGKAGPQTLQALMGSSFVVPISNSSDAADAKACSAGDKGSAVTALQQRLYELGYYTYGTITGYYGPVTKNAVKRFQLTNGLMADGIAGQDTLELLNSDNAQYYCIYPGDKGTDVKELQLRLLELGYFNKAATGYFGTATQKSLMEFQKQCNLLADAVAGKETRSLLFSGSAPRWDKTIRVAETELSTFSESSVDKMLFFANAQLGKKYTYLADGPRAFDAQGFIRYVLRYMGYNVTNRSLSSLSSTEEWIKISDATSLLPGDIMFFGDSDSSKVSHTAIFIGDGQFIHASASLGCVKISRFSGYYKKSFCVARRIF